MSLRAGRARGPCYGRGRVRAVDRPWLAASLAIVGWLLGYVATAGAPAFATGVDPPILLGSSQVRDGGVAAVSLLQLNLCDSGFANCFTGRATAEAAVVIREQAPDLVTLNEVCEDDVAVLGRALGDVVAGGVVASAFQAAFDRRTGGSVHCRDGQLYGIGVISRWALAARPAIHEGIFPAQIQDGRSSEGRAWLCLDAAAGPDLTVCTTHLANAQQEIARAQCAYLFDTVIAGLRARDASVPVVVGGDLNLAGADSPWTCTPPGFAHVDDAGLQHVVGTPGFVVDDRRTIDLRGTTDHPALLVTLTAAARQAGSAAHARAPG